MQLLVFRKGFCSKCLQPLGCVISTQSHCSILKFLFVCFVFSFCSFIFPQANLYRACQWGIARKPIMWARQICPALFPLAVILLLVLSIHRFGRRCKAVTDSHVWLGTPVMHQWERKTEIGLKRLTDLFPLLCSPFNSPCWAETILWHVCEARPAGHVTGFNQWPLLSWQNCCKCAVLHISITVPVSVVHEIWRIYSGCSVFGKGRCLKLKRREKCLNEQNIDGHDTLI